MNHLEGGLLSGSVDVTGFGWQHVAGLKVECSTGAHGNFWSIMWLVEAYEYHVNTWQGDSMRPKHWGVPGECLSMFNVKMFCCRFHF